MDICLTVHPVRQKAPSARVNGYAGLVARGLYSQDIHLYPFHFCPASGGNCQKSLRQIPVRAKVFAKPVNYQ